MFFRQEFIYFFFELADDWLVLVEKENSFVFFFNIVILLHKSIFNDKVVSASFSACFTSLFSKVYGICIKTHKHRQTDTETFVIMVDFQVEQSSIVVLTNYGTGINIVKPPSKETNKFILIVTTPTTTITTAVVAAAAATSNINIIIIIMIICRCYFLPFVIYIFVFLFLFKSSENNFLNENIKEERSTFSNVKK